MKVGNWVVWGQENGQVVARDGNMCLVRLDSFAGVEVWVRAEKLVKA